MNTTTDKPLPQWTYSNYRAALKRNDEFFAIVTPDGRAALNEKDATTLLELLNARPATADTQALAESIVRHLAQFGDRLTHGFEGHVGAVARLIDAARPADSADTRIGWKPIGTHPRNEVIIVTDWENIEFSADEPTDAGGMEGDNGLEWTPTHWMAIPLRAALTQPASADVAPAEVKIPGMNAPVQYTEEQRQHILAHGQWVPFPVAPAPRGERQERCEFCGNLTSDWLDVEWSNGRICRDCEAKNDPERATPSAETPKRQHLVETAAYWFYAARTHQEAGRWGYAMMAMENAYNHVENALAALHASRSKDWIFIAAAQDLAREANDKLDAAVAEVERLKEAINDVCAMIDEGFLVRDTSRDGASDWAVKTMRFMQRLVKITSLRAAAKPTP